MVIGINLLYLIPTVVGGTETYARELINSMCKKLSEQDTLIIFCGRESAQTFTEKTKLKIVCLPIYSTNRILRVIAEQLLLPFYCSYFKVNLLLSLGYSQPLILPCKSIVTIHDLNWYYYPTDFSKLSLYIWKYLTIYSALRANAIIAISNSTKKSLITILKIDPLKISVIYHGIPRSLSINNSTILAVSAKYKLPKQYIFTTLSHYSHKNLETLVKAFLIVQSKIEDLHLLIGGTGTNLARASRKKYINSLGNSHIHLLPFVDHAELSVIYQLSQIFVFPSAYEGFGLPVLEAMAHKVPVISSNAYSLEEVVGQGGILVDTYEVDEYVSAIKKLLQDKIIRNKYVQAGTKQAMKFNWDNSAQETLNLIRSIKL